MSPKDVRLHPGQHDRYRWRYKDRLQEVFTSGRHLDELSVNSYLSLRDAIDWGDAWAIPYKCVRFSKDTEYVPDDFWREHQTRKRNTTWNNNLPVTLIAELYHLRRENEQLKDRLIVEQNKNSRFRRSLWNAEIQLKKTVDIIRYGA